MQTRYIWRMKSLPGGAKRLYDLVRINTKIFFWIWNSFIHVLASNYVMLHVPDLKSPLAHFHRLFYLWLFDLLVYFWLLPPKDFHPKCLLLEFALSIESITICKQDQVDNNNNKTFIEKFNFLKSHYLLYPLEQTLGTSSNKILTNKLFKWT